MEVREGFLDVARSPLYYRVVGEGPPVVIVHGGSDLDHNYLLPEFDRLADKASLIYYDQRGRGRSAVGVGSDDVGIESETEDLDAIRRHFGGETVALIGHSWGGLLASEYALRYPQHVSHLILMNTAPLSASGSQRTWAHIARLRTPEDAQAMADMRSTLGFQRGDVDADIEYCRLHLTPAIADEVLLGDVAKRMREHFTPETILLARAIDQRLMDQTWSSPGYDLLPGLRGLEIPTLVVHGDYDFIPVEIAEEIAGAMPTAELRILQGLGHFAYAEDPEGVAGVVWEFLGVR